MEYKFKNTLTNINSSDIEEKDIIKFLVLGWYIYCVLKKKEEVI
jgi:hypothetical protein